jgi:hypothetical protein
VTVAVTRNTNSGRRCLASEDAGCLPKHRLSFNGNRWDTLWLSGRGKTPTLCVFPVFIVAFMGKCCDACGDGEYYFRSCCLASEDCGVYGASIVVDQKWMGNGD